jgi:hypothetical protein
MVKIGRMKMRESNYKPSVKSAAVLFTCALLIGSMVFSSGCATSAGPSQTPPIVAVEVSRNKNSYVPAFYAVFDDKSGSVKSARIAPIQEQDLMSIIDILRQTGGELSFGLIGESSDRPLLRLRIPVPPPLPPRHDSQNAFERAEQDSTFQEEMESYNAKRQRWEADVNQRINAFMEAVRPRLQEPAREKATDINSALARAELFLNEPAALWPAETAQHKYIILNSDGVATVNRKPIEIKSHARLLLINGSGSVGTIAALQPLRFESKQAAIAFIEATELGRDK